MPRISALDPNAATGDAKLLLEVVQKKLGMTPNLIRSLAHSPAALKAYLGLGEALSGGQFDAKDREAIALTVAGANGCEYCASAHTAVSKSFKVDEIEISQRLEGHSGDPRLDAALIFARKIVDSSGFVADEDIAAVRGAGHDEEAIVEIVANVAANIFTNYFNHVAQTEIDFPKVDLAAAKAA
jgi:uncharacterized peroxidase-related enzyme